MTQPWTPLQSRAVALQRDDIDTDQIIPARFLTTTTRAGLGTHLFADWRYEADGTPNPEFVLNQPASAGSQVLVAGRNFGCGSSREHAPWALSDWGFRAVIAGSFADIFRSNAHKNGLLTIAIDDTTLAALHASLAADATAEIAVDLAAQVVHLPGGATARFSIDPFAKRCLLDGLDELGALLADLPAIEAWEAACGR